MMDLLLLRAKGGAPVEWSVSGALPAGLAFARASSGTRINANGAVELCGVNEPRFQHSMESVPLGLLLEPQRTNVLRNSMMVGAVAGTPGTLPTYWNVSLPSGLAYAVVGTGIEYGMNYLDLRIYGSSSAGSQMAISYVVQSVAAQGQSWTHSLYARLVGGAKTNLSAFYVAADEQSGSTYLGSSQKNILSVLGETIDRYFVMRDVVNATANKIQPIIKIMASGLNVAIDFTLRLSAPQCELGNSVSSFVPTSSVASTRAADQLTVPVPAGASIVRCAFDDGSTQDVSVSVGSFVLPVPLNRACIKHISCL